MPSPSVPEHPDVPRMDPDLQTGELPLLAQFLDYHRATLELKCAGLDDDQLKTKATPPSTLCLLGLIRHLTEVEYWWFAVWLDGQPDKAFYYTPNDPDGDFDNVDSQPVPDVWSAYHRTVAESRRILGTYADGGEPARGGPGQPRNLRWILTHMIEEYARHNGHADLLRQSIDGSVGE